MKSTFPSTAPLVAVLAAAVLTGCANMPGAQHRQHHPQTSASQSPGYGSSGTSAGQAGMMDMKAMCAMHEKMMSAKTPEERRAMMDDRMKNMSPQEMQKQMDIMRQQCQR